MKKGLHHIAILCSDREKALDFYSRALGFEIIRSHLRPERNDEIIMMSGFGITLELFISPSNPKRVTSPEAYGLRHLALYVTDIESEVTALKNAGYMTEEIRRDSFSGEKMTFVKDPDGLPIELHE